MLYGGLRLAEAEQWAEGNSEQLNEQGATLFAGQVGAGAGGGGGGARTSARRPICRQRVGRILRWSMAGVGFLLVVAIVAAWQAMRRQVVQTLKNAIQASQW